MVRRLVFLAALSGAACSFPEAPLPPGDRRLVVQSVLDPSRRFQIVDLSHTEGHESRARELDTALVEITTPNGTVLTARQDSALMYDGQTQKYGLIPRYRIDLQSAGVSLAPGGTYTLRITTRLGDVISGSTTIPSATVGDLTPSAIFRKLADTLRLTWARVPDAYTNEVQVWHALLGVAPSELSHQQFVDSSLVLAGTAKSLDGDEVFLAGVRSTVYVLAVDANYYEYYRLLSDPFTGAAPSRLSGALGVFGSVVPVIRRRLDVR
jgi:hypothetical protein